MLTRKLTLVCLAGQRKDYGLMNEQTRSMKMAKYTHDTYAVEIYDRDGVFVGYNKANEVVMLYTISDPMLVKKTIMQWKEENRYKGRA
jgi:hypothetical protein